MDLSEKELSVIQDLLNEEELLVKKLDISQKHQGHFNSIYSYVK